VRINSCCLRDVRARDRFLSELEQRIEELRHPPLDESCGAILLDHLDWLWVAITESRRLPMTSTPRTSRGSSEDLHLQGSGPRDERTPEPGMQMVGEAGIETTSRRFSRAIVSKPERPSRSPSHGGTSRNTA